MSSTELSSNMCVKRVETDIIASETDIMNSVSCFAQLPDPAAITMSICKIISPQSSAA